MATKDRPKNLKPFKPGDFFSDDDNRVKEFMNKPGVRDKIWQMSQKYGVSPNEIVYTIYKESAGSFSPQQPGSASSAVGLFQIMPDKDKNYRDFISYEPWGEGLEGTEQWRMRGGEEWGKFPLVAGEQYSSKNQKGYQKGKRRFYMDDIAKMNELQQLELFDLYLGEKFRGSDYREGNVSKGGPGDIYTSVAWPDAVGLSGDETVIERGTTAYKDNKGWRSGLLKTGNITPNSIRKFGGNQKTWDSKFTNEELGYDENYVPVEDPNPYPQFRFDDEGRVTFESVPKSVPKSVPGPKTQSKQDIPESPIDYSQFELPSFESDKTRVAPFPPVPTTGAVGSWDMFMNSYNESGLPTEGFEEGGKVWKEGDAPIDFGMLPEITLTDRDPHRNKYSNSPLSRIRKNWAENLNPFGYGKDKRDVLDAVIQTGLGNPDTRKIGPNAREKANDPNKKWAKERVDFLSMLMGESQKYGSVPVSDYQIEGDPTTYYSSPYTEGAMNDLLFRLRLKTEYSDFTGEDLENVFAGRPIGNINKYGEEFNTEEENEHRVQDAKKIQEEFKNFQHSITRGDEGGRLALGDFSTKLKVSNDGNPYIEYNDTWDLNPIDKDYERPKEKGFGPFINNVLGRQKVDDIVTGFNKHILGMTPPKIKGRVYLKKGGQVIKNNDMKYNNYRYGGGYYGVPNYGDGGLFKSIFGKKFKDSGFGKGLRDMGVATLNTAASPFESLMGTDFGIDEKFGYKTKFGETYGGVGETAGSILGQLAPAALNMVAPGVGTGISMAAQGIGSGLEGAGITQDISTDPQSAAGANIGSMMSMFAGMNPSGGAGQFTQGMADTGFMQQLAGIFTGGQSPTMRSGGMTYKYGQGGVAGPDIEVESGEVINSPGNMRSFTPGAPLNSVGSGAVQVGGNISHEKGGVKVGVNQNAQVFSATLKPEGSKQTYAQHAKTLNQMIEKEEKNVKSSDFISRETAELNIKKYKKQLESLFASQQKQNQGNTNVMAKEGTQYTKPSTQETDTLWYPPQKGVSFLNNIFNDKSFYAIHEDPNASRMHTIPGIDRPEGISSSMNALKFDPQSDINTGGTRRGMQAGPYSNLDRSVSRPMIEGPNYYGHKTYPTGSRFNRNTPLPKAKGGLQYNPNFGGSTGGGFGGMYGTGTSTGSGSNFGIPGWSSTPGANTFNALYGDGTSGGGFGNLQGSNPSQYERVPFESQYSGMKGIMPYAGSALNLGLGIAGLMNQSSIDSSKYMIQPELKNTQLNKSAMMAPDMQAYITALNSVNDPRYKMGIHANYMPQLLKRSEGIEFLQNKLKGENVDTINKYKALNASTQYGVDMKNLELASKPYEFLGQAATDIGATSQQMGQNKMMEQMLYNTYPQYRKVS